MTDPAPPDLTRILQDSRDGASAGATDRLVEALYPELRKVARALMRRERRDHTLQPTALVGEVFLRLVDQTRIAWRDRAHFLGVAARVMRQILVDHARRHAAAKRGAGVWRVTFDESLGHGLPKDMEIVALHEALTRLSEIDPRGAQVVELRVFGGSTVEEVAQTLGVSKRTVDDDWAVARMWLARELK